MTIGNLRGSVRNARSVHSAISLSAVSACLALAGVPAAAQTVPATPGRDELQSRTTPPATPERQVSVEGDIERSPCALSDPAYANIKVTLTDVAFNNLGPVDAGDLADSYAEFIGHEAPVSVLCDIRDRAATRLRQMGYLAAVQVPTQRIEGGRVRFEVLFARMTAVRVRGDAGPSQRLFERYLGHLTEMPVFNRIEAERYLLLARDVPGYDVRLVLKPAGTGPGEMVGEVTLRRTRVVVDATIQDYGARETGRFGGQLRAEFYGLTGMGDRTQVSIYSTSDFKEQQVLALAHDFLVGGNGLRFSGRFTYAWTRPDLGPTVPPVHAETLFATAEASYPIVRRQSLGLIGAAGFDFVNQNVQFNGGPLSRDRLRIGFIRLDADAIDMRGVGPGGTTGWRLAGSLELRRGFDVLSASPDCVTTPIRCTAAGAVPPSLVDSNPTATVIRFQGNLDVRLLRRVSLSFAPRAQYSGSALSAFEQFSLGNYTVGRGFDPGVFAGDSGVGFATEIKVLELPISRKFSIAAEPYAFIDSAWVWNRYSAPGVDPQQISSVGAGMRLTWNDRARLDLNIAVPTRSAGAIRAGDVRILLNLTTRLIPWGNR